MRSFGNYSEALTYADKLVKDLANGSPAAAFTATAARDAQAALARLETYWKATGRRLSLHEAVAEYCDCAGKLNGHTLGEAVTGYLGTVASVQRKDIGQAVEDFIKGEEPRTKAPEGKRPEVSPKYHYNRAIMLRRFANAFTPPTCVKELTKEHLDRFLGSLSKIKSKSHNARRVVSAKARNHHRAAIRQFLQWAVRKDFLAATHRLGEADSLRPEHANDGEVQLYTPDELQALLDAAKGPMRALIAIGGLCGLRTAEMLRLTWENVWRVAGHIEVTARGSKTRQRRLVEVCPALAQWLEPYRACTGKLWELHEITFQQHFGDLCGKAKVDRKANGLRHSFCSYHFAAHQNENATSM